MKTHDDRSRRCLLSTGPIVPALLAGCLMATGCSRTLTITQDNVINTAQQIEDGIDTKDHTGAPLELTAVCVYPKDLKNEANDRLKPGSGITAKEWYERRPLPGDRVDMEATHNRFRLPKNQVFLMTDSSEVYGSRIGSWLRGAQLDGAKPIVKKGIEFDSFALHDDLAVIYIFPKFTRKGGEVLPVQPVVFHPPGAYEKDVYIRIGVDPKRDNFGQYIEIDHEKSPRKLHGKEKN
ncbi:MAG: hypothetical protein AMXMBFR13_21020 [Phycisphaerae bacterium]|jgi:hypothetical protein